MDALTAAALALAALCGFSLGDGLGMRRTTKQVLNERDYLRGQIARDAGDLVPPPPPDKTPGLIQRVLPRWNDEKDAG